MKSKFAAMMFVSVLLGGCGSDAPPPAPPAAPATTPAVAPAAAPAPEAASTAPASGDGAAVAEPVAVPTAPETPAAAPEAAAETTPGKAATTALAAAPVADATFPAPSGPPPREGVDFQIIDPPQPLSQSPGRIEVAEVFAYYCIHCSTLQTRVTPWKSTLPADAEFRYVPMAHGQSEPFARAFYAAEAMGELDRSHEAMFKAVAVDRKIRQGTTEEIADLYASFGVDREALLSTMKSFAVNAQIARNQKAVTRWAIEATPTFVVAGRYRATVTADRGQEGLLSTVEHLIARERAAGTSAAR